MNKLSKEELLMLKKYEELQTCIKYLELKITEAQKTLEFLDEKDDYSYDDEQVIARFKKKLREDADKLVKIKRVPMITPYNQVKEGSEFAILNGDCRIKLVKYLTDPIYRHRMVISKKYHQLVDEHQVNFLKRDEFAAKYRELIMNELKSGTPIKEAVKVIKL